MLRTMRVVFCLLLSQGNIKISGILSIGKSKWKKKYWKEIKFFDNNDCSKNVLRKKKCWKHSQKLNIAQGKTTESIYIAKYLCISLHWVWFDFDYVLRSKDVRGVAIQYWWHSTPMYNVTYSQWGSKSLSGCFFNFHGATISPEIFYLFHFTLVKFQNL